MVYTGRWYGPAAVPIATFPCDDYEDNHDYEGECTSTVPPLNCPIPPSPYYDQSDCAQRSALHAPGYTVCANCVEATEDEHWFKLAKAKICNPPPDNKPSGRRETKRWRGFWTHMCRTCEQSEQYLIRFREGYGGVLVVHPSPARQALMQNYPRNTCTCLWRLRNARRCKPHYRQHWANLKAILEPKRNENAEWLRTLARHPTTGQSWTANSTRQDNRYYIRNGCMLRACRCGREVTRQKPEAYQCMACEGIIQVTPMPLPLDPPTPLQQINSATFGKPFALGRRRNDRMC
jgi:hypothetical protein